MLGPAHDLAFNLAMLAVDAGALALVRRRPGWSGVLAGGAFAACAAAALAIAGALLFGHDPMFACMRFVAWATFLHGALLLCGGAWILRRRSAWRLGLAVSAAVVLGVALEAFWREPKALELTRLALTSSKLERPVRIGVVADLQTDATGAYERGALRLLMAEKPDLILFAGDYAHVLDAPRREREWESLNRLFHEVGLAAPLGVYAVQGDVDPDGWQRAFAGIDAELFTGTRRVERGGLTLTGLSYSDGARVDLAVAGVPGLHVVLAHRPDFALGAIEADLLVAGHTHGGQVRLPFFGPLLTLSEVPRAWAAGLTALSGERSLLVSRGVGMERGDAPRLRFLCPPEIVVLDVLPAEPRPAK